MFCPPWSPLHLEQRVALGRTQHMLTECLLLEGREGRAWREGATRLGSVWASGGRNSGSPTVLAQEHCPPPCNPRTRGQILLPQDGRVGGGARKGPLCSHQSLGGVTLVLVDNCRNIITDHEMSQLLHLGIIRLERLRVN